MSLKECMELATLQISTGPCHEKQASVNSLLMLNPELSVKSQETTQNYVST